MPADVLRELGVAEGDSIDPGSDAERIAGLEESCAWQRALRLLRYRGRGSGELAGRLRDDGCSAEVTALVIERLTSCGLLDDERFAEALAHTLVDERGFSRFRASREMLAKGLPDELVRHALDAVLEAESGRDRAFETAERLYRTSDTAERLAGRLVRRGYAPGDSLRAARQVLEEHPL